MLWPDGTWQPSLRRFPTVLGTIWRRTPLRLLRRPYEHQVSHYGTRPSEPVQGDWLLGGACLLMRRRMLEQLGGWDGGYRHYVEDIDVAYRAAQAGWERWLVPDAVVRHDYAAVIDKRFLSRHTLWHLRGMLRFLRKHPERLLRPPLSALATGKRHEGEGDLGAEFADVAAGRVDFGWNERRRDRDIDVEGDRRRHHDDLERARGKRTPDHGVDAARAQAGSPLTMTVPTRTTTFAVGMFAPQAPWRDNDDPREPARHPFVRRVLGVGRMLAHPAVGGDAVLGVAEPGRRSDVEERHPAVRLSHALADDLDAVPVTTHSTPGFGAIVPSGAPRSGESDGSGRRPVEAPDLVDRAVPELEQPDRVRVVDVLPEVERRLPSRRPVDPVDRLRRAAVQTLREEVESAGGVDLAS